MSYLVWPSIVLLMLVICQNVDALGTGADFKITIPFL